MTFVTKLSFASGDHDVLAETVQDLKSTLERKGAGVRVHTPRPPRPSAFHFTNSSAPATSSRRGTTTCTSALMEIHGADDIAREVVGRDFPDSIHVEVEVDQKKPLGHRRD